jgi:hypothetical protein
MRRKEREVARVTRWDLRFVSCCATLKHWKLLEKIFRKLPGKRIFAKVCRVHSCTPHVARWWMGSTGCTTHRRPRHGPMRWLGPAQLCERANTQPERSKFGSRAATRFHLVTLR